MLCPNCSCESGGEVTFWTTLGGYSCIEQGVPQIRPSDDEKMVIYFLLCVLDRSQEWWCPHEPVVPILVVDGRDLWSAVEGELMQCSVGCSHGVSVLEGLSGYADGWSGIKGDRLGE